MKLVHSPESKLEKASFTGSCNSLGNPKAADYNVKKQYQKSLNAFEIYWKAMLMCAWRNMIKKNKMLGEGLATAKNRGEEHFIAELRFASF